MTIPLLLLEDDPAIARTVAYALEREGFTVEHVGLVREAMQKLADPQHAYAAAILDVGLPDGSGLDLCRDLRRDAGRMADCPSSCSPRGVKSWTACWAWNWAPTTT